MKKTKAVCIFWRDAHSNDSWVEREEIIKWAKDSFNEVNRTYGEIFEMNKDYILVCASYTPTKDLVGDCMMIPKIMIVKIVKLKEGKVITMAKKLKGKGQKKKVKK